MHRVQRVPTTEAAGRIHTSTATVSVLPEADEVELEIHDKDLRIDVYRSQRAGRAEREHHRLARSASPTCRPGRWSPSRTRRASTRTAPRRCRCCALGCSTSSAAAGRGAGRGAPLAGGHRRPRGEDPHLQLPATTASPTTGSGSPSTTCPACSRATSTGLVEPLAERDQAERLAGMGGDGALDRWMPPATVGALIADRPTPPAQRVTLAAGSTPSCCSATPSHGTAPGSRPRRRAELPAEAAARIWPAGVDPSRGGRADRLHARIQGVALAAGPDRRPRPHSATRDGAARRGCDRRDRLAPERRCRRPPIIVWEVGTGSGAFALALALRFRVRAPPRAPAAGRRSDLSTDALELAAENLADHRVGRPRHACVHRPPRRRGGSAAAPDLVVANLPYVASDEVRAAGGIARARAGRLARRRPGWPGPHPQRCCAPPRPPHGPAGSLLLEVGAGPGGRGARPRACRIDRRARRTDMAGIERVVRIGLPSAASA